MIETRDLVQQDLDALVRWRNDPAVNRYLSDRMRTPEEAASWFEHLRTNSKVWLKAICEDGRLIGYATVESIDEKNRKCELALVIGESDCWGKGIGKSVLRDMLRYAFDSLGMHRVWAVVARGNERSERLVRRAGLVQEGVMRETILIGGKFVDLLCYSMLEDEYISHSA
jgi:RimJ/RimL family protein N-acetyltransferase